MGKIMILNGSPRAPKSNSKQYSELFAKYSSLPCDYFNIGRSNHEELIEKMRNYSDLLIVFPLYADSLPVGLLNFMKSLESNPPSCKPVVSVLINCGFLEYEQNNVAVSMIKYFCKRQGYSIGSILMLGSGEAILTTPFRFIAVNAIKSLSLSICKRDYKESGVTMPLPKWLFKLAATSYWTRYGKRFGISKTEMSVMEIEKEESKT